MVTTTIIDMLATDVTGFTIGNYLLSKAADIGTGRIWTDIKKKVLSKPRSLESCLYNSIEESVNRYATNVGPDALEKKAIACELIYYRWITIGHIETNDVRQALKSINYKVIGTQNIDYWYRLFYEELTKDENLPLFKWYVTATQKELFRYIRKRDEDISSMIRKCLEVLDRKELGNTSRATEKDRVEAIIKRPILGENVVLEDIYVPIHAVIRYRNIPYEDNDRMIAVDATTFLWEWYLKQDESVIFLHGEPGIGKSSLLKMAVATMASELYAGYRISFVELHKVRFSAKKDVLDSLREYICNNSPNFLDADDSKSRRLLVVDGVDEIKQNLYETAEELLIGIGEIEWGFPVSIIISGRTNIMKKYIDSIRGLEMEILPLYMDEYDYSRKSSSEDVNGYLEEDLRPLLWEKLTKAFSINREMPLINERFDDLSKSPLMMFLVVWTMKNTDRDFNNFRNPADLYDCILRHIYTREYNRIEKKYIYYNEQEYKEYQQMLKHLGGCATRLSGKSVRLQDMFEYCHQFGHSDLCERWIQKHRDSNPSKLVLLFFLREYQDIINWSISEIEFVHKTFCDYLGALSLLDFIHSCSMRDDDDTLFMAFYLLSNRPIDVNTIKFMGEILSNGNSENTDSWLNFKAYTNDLENIVIKTINVDYPFSTVEKDRYIMVGGYTELIHRVQTYCDNIKALIELVTDPENGFSSDYVFDFTCADFSKANFQRWIFDGSIMEEIRFDSSQLSGAFFRGCELQGAMFQAAYADCAYFCNSNLSEVDFTSCSLSSADFTGAICIDTCFAFSTLCGSYFCDSTLDKTDFSAADLIAANFDNTILKEVNFADADLSRADFSNAVFVDVIWDNSVLDGANLKGVKVNSFNLNEDDILEMLSEARLEEADWEGVPTEIRKRLLNK